VEEETPKAGRTKSFGHRGFSVWTPAELKLLGTMPDEQLAKKSGRTKSAIINRRCREGINIYRRGQKQRSRFGPSKISSSVESRQKNTAANRRSRAASKARPWLDEHLAVLGTMSDLDAAEVLNRTSEACRVRRSLAKIPMFREDGQPTSRRQLFGQELPAV